MVFGLVGLCSDQCKDSNKFKLAQLFNGTFVMVVGIKNELPNEPVVPTPINPHLFSLSSEEYRSLYDLEETIELLVKGEEIHGKGDGREFEILPVGLLDANEATREGIVEVLRYLNTLELSPMNQNGVVVGGDQLTTKMIRGFHPSFLHPPHQIDFPLNSCKANPPKRKSEGEYEPV